MKIIATFITIALTSTLLLSQEICNNGIDDDSDGLIDLNDTTDCQCHVPSGLDSIPSLITNPSFEDHSCCPTTYGNAGQVNDGLGCADGWIQVGGATSDYFNTCGWNGATNSLPFPNGEAAVGVFSVDDWSEFIGGYLPDTLFAGVEYKITFFLGFDAMTGSVESCGEPNGYAGPIDFTLYGTPDTNDIPFEGYECPRDSGQWQELGHVNIDASTIFETWEELTILFTPDTNIIGFAIGPPCNLDSYGYGNWSVYGNDCAPYFLIDNLILNKSEYFNHTLNIDSVGSYETNLTLNAHADTVGTYQWYLNGIAIVGETDSVIDITTNGYYAGNYQVVFSYASECIVENITVESILNIIEQSISDIHIYPNPNNGTFTIKGKEIESIIVTDVNGKVIYINSNTNSVNNISILDAAKGIYFVKIFTKNNVIVKKLLIN